MSDSYDGFHSEMDRFIAPEFLCTAVVVQGFSRPRCYFPDCGQRFVSASLDSLQSVERSFVQYLCRSACSALSRSSIDLSPGLVQAKFKGRFETGGRPCQQLVKLQFEPLRNEGKRLLRWAPVAAFDEADIRRREPGLANLSLR